MSLEEPFPGIKKNTEIDSKIKIKRKEEYMSIVSKMNHQLKQQIIDDVVALSIIVASENFHPIPEINRSASNFSLLLNSYKELNQPYIASQINFESNDKNEIEFTPLIVDNVFCLKSFQKIMTKFLDMRYCHNRNKKNKSDKKTDLVDKIKSENSKSAFEDSNNEVIDESDFSEEDDDYDDNKDNFIQDDDDSEDKQNNNDRKNDNNNVNSNAKRGYETTNNETNNGNENDNSNSDANNDSKNTNNETDNDDNNETNNENKNDDNETNNTNNNENDDDNNANNSNNKENKNDNADYDVNIGCVESP